LNMRRGKSIQFGILFTFSPFYEYRNLEHLIEYEHVFLSNTGCTRRNMLFIFIFLWLRPSQEYMNIYDLFNT